ncbi:unnamed protein product, partial [Brenthis ino]
MQSARSPYYITPSKLHFCEEYTYFRSESFYRNGWQFWRYSCSCLESKNCEAHVYIHKDEIIITDTAHNHSPLGYKWQSSYNWLPEAKCYSIKSTHSPEVERSGVEDLDLHVPVRIARIAKLTFMSAKIII